MNISHVKNRWKIGNCFDLFTSSMNFPLFFLRPDSVVVFDEGRTLFQQFFFSALSYLHFWIFHSFIHRSSLLFYIHESLCTLSASTPQVEVCVVILKFQLIFASLSWKLKTIKFQFSYLEPLCKARIFNLNNIIVKPSVIHWSWRRATFHFHNCSLKLNVLALKFRRSCRNHWALDEMSLNWDCSARNS